MKLGEAARSILTKNGKTPISEKYLYRESQGLWFIVSVLERIETEEHVTLKLRIEDILWRKGRHDIGDSFSCSCSKIFYYPTWRIQFLKVALYELMDVPNIAKTKEKYPELDLDSENDIIKYIKITRQRESRGERKSDN